MKTIKNDLILTEDTSFDESIKVNGNIRCKNGRWNLKVRGNIYAVDIDARSIDAENIYAGDIDAWNIDAMNIDAGDIDAMNIDAMNIDAMNIDAENINAGNIDAWNIIFCQSIRLKDKTAGKIRARAVIRDRFGLEQKEFEGDKT